MNSPHFTRACLALVLFVLATGPMRADDARPPMIAVCGAYAPEMKALKEEFGAETFTREVIKGIQFWHGPYAGKEIIIFRTGMSPVNAAYQLQIAFDHFNITHVLFAGVAGGTDPALHVGDVVIPERWAYHDEAAYLNADGQGGYHVPDYFTPRFENFGMIFPDTVAVVKEGQEEYVDMPTFPVDAGLLALARQVVPNLPAMQKEGRDVVVSVGGTGVAGSVFLDNADYRKWVFRVWQARCLDMESTALAHVAYVNEKPMLIIRGLSDLAGAQDGKNPIDHNELPVSRIAVKVLRGMLDAME